MNLRTIGLLWCFATITSCTGEPAMNRPNIILIMTDDQGWGQTGYYDHPVLKTPNIDDMAENGLRLDRFYAGAPVCSPTRASVLTGRSPERTGVPSHGHALRRQEKTISQALKSAGYTTGHFGKWHLNALRGPGVPIFKDDPHGPPAFGFERWISVTNFFEIDPLMSDQGDFKDFTGTSSEIIVNQALEFIRNSIQSEKPFFAVIWDGSPHSPWLANEEDAAPFSQLDENSRLHYGELVAFDRSLGVLRKTLRELDVADNTILWYCSDNGGLPRITPTTVGNLRGFKGSVWEGGLRVPGIIEWPAVITPGISDYPAATMDIFPTLADILDLPVEVVGEPLDGISIQPLFTQETPERETGLPFRYRGQGALVDNNYKLVATSIEEQTFELYDLSSDPGETVNIATSNTEVFSRMKDEFMNWSRSVDASVQGKDYPEGKVYEDHAESHFWMEDPRYEPYLDEWEKKEEYVNYIKRVR